MSEKLHGYSPWGVFTPVTMSTRADVTFVCGADSITLRLPDFGNAEEVDVDRVINVSRGGTPNIFRDPQWTKSTEITVGFSVLTRAKALELLDFLKNCLGLLVTYTDPDDRIWEGIVTNPESAVIDGGGITDCKYGATITLGAANPV